MTKTIVIVLAAAAVIAGFYLWNKPQSGGDAMKAPVEEGGAMMTDK